MLLFILLPGKMYAVPEADRNMILYSKPFVSGVSFHPLAALSFYGRPASVAYKTALE